MSESKADDSNPLLKVLTTTMVEPFRYGPDKPLVVIRAHWAVERALRVLSSHAVQSAPLLRQVAGSEPPAWEISGVVDVQDLATFILDSVCPRDKPATEAVDDFSGSTPSSASDTVFTTANLSCNNPTQTIGSAACIADALPLLHGRIRRLLITDPRAGVIGVLSQTDVLKAVAADYDALDVFSQIKIQDVPGAVKDLVTCSTETPAADAIRTMLDGNLSAVALTDEAKGPGIVANFSMSDVRGLALLPKDDWPELLKQPVIAFLTCMRKANDTGRSLFVDPSGRKVDRLVSVRPTDVIGTAVNLILATKLHRIWIIDREGVPHGLLSVSDILKVVLSKARELKPSLFPAPEASAGGAAATTED